MFSLEYKCKKVVLNTDLANRSTYWIGKLTYGVEINLLLHFDQNEHQLSMIFPHMENMISGYIDRCLVFAIHIDSFIDWTTMYLQFIKLC